LAHLDDLAPTEWLQHLKIFGRDISSIIPGHFEAYARVYHPFGILKKTGYESPSPWRDLPEFAGVDIGDVFEIGDVSNGVGNARITTGSAPLSILKVLMEHLGPATTTPGKCYFAVWYGFGSLAVPASLEPRLKFPDREYHVFAGPIEAVETSYDAYIFGHHDQYANLWWPADHAWCVVTEVDHAWTYVGGSRECINTVLADPLLESMETSARSRW
jgi:hypothetical protein